MQTRHFKLRGTSAPLINDYETHFSLVSLLLSTLEQFFFIFLLAGTSNADHWLSPEVSIEVIKHFQSAIQIYLSCLSKMVRYFSASH